MKIFKSNQIMSWPCPLYVFNLIAIFDSHGSYHSVKIKRYYCLFLQFKVNSFKVIIIFIPSNIGSFSDLKTIMDNSGKSNDSNPHSQNNQIYRESVESRHQSHLNQSQDPKTNNTSAIVGVAVGVSILIILIIAVVIFVRYKKKYRWYPRMSLGFSNAMYRREIDESYWLEMLPFLIYYCFLDFMLSLFLFKFNFAWYIC